MATNVYTRPASTSWGAVLGGWIASIGAMALVAPGIAALLANVRGTASDVAPAVPVILGLFISYLIGGYVAGRMAGYRTSWHGMMTAFFSLFVILALMLVGYAASQGLFASTGAQGIGDVVPGVRDLDLYTFGNALTFGALLGFLASIFAGWLGGVLAPSHAAIKVGTPVAAAPAVASRPADRVEKREVVRERRPLVPAAMVGRKGGERMEERDETRVERR